MKTWVARVRDTYKTLTDLKAYDSVFKIAERCGYKTVEKLWRANPYIGGSVDPIDFGKATKEEIKQLAK